ncbi:hypothetical protein GCM10010435_19960 [Winogradskya consettensis]|uniref:N-acetyltransferase domain-containing protein n=1 Tax=Winogradskya consettensis TaxID=113560 RepID=A0A919W397_9ACTN|nr:GNAT family N-acetyltransferase [Actinoplanes consettensis]GIM78178.1 hypothetical protein Aco04nite_59090 [Actinoplanes consettensis]
MIQAETVEAEFMYAYESGVSGSPLDITTARIGGGVALAMRNDPAGGYWNKALGFGVTEPVTREVVGAVVEHFRAYGNGRAVIQIAPSLLPPDWDDIKAAYGITKGTSWMKLGARADAIEAAPTDLRIAPVTPRDAREWAAVVLETFGMPAGGLTEMLVASVEHPSFHPFAAWDGDRIVAAANLFVHDGMASLNTGATVPGYRGRGAQSALIAARADVARKAGCEWIGAETGVPAEGARNPSLENLRRLGLRDLYIRDNWIWTQK